MKRIIAILIAWTFFCTFTACGEMGSQSSSHSFQSVQTENQPGSSTGSSSTPSAASSKEKEEEPVGEGGESRVLVAYFSATGNTENVAQHLQTILDADLYAIEPELPYTDEDLYYSDENCRANQEQNDPDARPAITGIPENVAEYDIIFLGYPIWWGQAPKVIYTFLESCAFKNSTIIPFCTSGSSGIGSSADNLQGLTENVQWLEGRRFAAGSSQDEIAQWVNSLALDL